MGMAGSSADSFECLSLVQKRSICKLLLLLNRANHSPLKTSQCRFPGWLVCGFYCCSSLSRSSFNLSVSLLGPAIGHRGGQLGPLVELRLCVLHELLTPGLEDRSAALQACPQGGPPDRGTSQGLEAVPGHPREGTQNIHIDRHGFQQVLCASCTWLSTGLIVEPPCLFLPLRWQVSMLETTRGAEGRVSGAPAEGGVVFVWVRVCACGFFFSAKAAAGVTRAILRRILQVPSRRGVSLRRCYSTTWRPRAAPRRAGGKGAARLPAAARRGWRGHGAGSGAEAASARAPFTVRWPWPELSES